MQFSSPSRSVLACQVVLVGPGQMPDHNRGYETLDHAKTEDTEETEDTEGIKGTEGTKIAVPCPFGLTSQVGVHRLSSANALSSASAIAARGRLVAQKYRFVAWRASLSGASAIQPTVNTFALPQPSLCQPSAVPNHSFKRSANGRPPGPRAGVVYHPARGPGVLPSSPA